MGLHGAAQRRMKEVNARRSFEVEDSSHCKFAHMFDEMDADGSGAVDRDELKNGLKRLGLPCDAHAVDRLFRRFDVDGNGTISRPEFADLANQIAYVTSS